MKFNKWRNLLAYIALTFASLAWAGNAVVGRMVKFDYTPLTLSFWRWSVAAALFFAFNIRPFMRELDVICREWRFILFGSILGMALFHLLQYVALASTGALNVSIIVAFAPILVFFSSICLGEQTASKKRLFGLFLSTTGVVLVVTQGHLYQIRNLNLGSGEAYMLIGIISWSAYSLLLRKKSSDLSAQAMTTAMAAVAVIALLPFYLLQVAKEGWPTPNAQFIYTVGYLGLCASFLAYSAFNYGLIAVGPTAASFFLNFCPLFTALLSFVFLKDPLEWFHAVGLGLVLYGFYLASPAALKRPARI